MDNEFALWEDQLESGIDESNDEDYEFAENDEFFENDEAARGRFSAGLPFMRRGATVRTAPNRTYTRPGITPYVTRPQFDSAMTKVREDISKNSQGLRTLGQQVNTVKTAINRQNRVISKQNQAVAKQNKAVEGLKKDLKKAQDSSLMMALFTRPKTLGETTAPQTFGGVTVPAGTKLAYEEKGSNSLLLALMLSGAMGGGDGDSSNPLLLALALGGGL